MPSNNSFFDALPDDEFPDDTEEHVNILSRENPARNIPFEPYEREEEVPENTPEVPEVPEVNERPVGYRISPSPRRPLIYFLTSGGSSIPAGREVRSGYQAQISFWDTNEPDTVREAFAWLKQWLIDNNFYINGSAKDRHAQDGITADVLYYFNICEETDRNAQHPNDVILQPECSCGETLDYPTIVCPYCQTVQFCSTCRTFGQGIERDEQYGTYCSNCSENCATHGNYHARYGSQCAECYPRVNCSQCGDVLYVNNNEVYEHEFENEEDGIFCHHCFNGLCHACGVVVAPENIIEDEGHNCIDCVSRNSNEEWDEGSNLETDSLVIPTIPGREVIRLVGVEIEGANGDDQARRDGGNILARRLYDEGLSSSHSMNGYHSGIQSKVYVERDSSVDWEMVIGPLNVADSNDVEILNRSVRVVRSFINDKTLKLDMRAGMHVHVGADKVPFHNAYNLHKLYMYMEDFLYRFGAAKWPYHRSVNRRGRDASGKSPITEGKLHFARTFSGQRYYGLSFDNYFARYFEGCGCGARTYGLFDECTCDLGKCTFEFRLFNTTANTVKVHAYVAICQALVAKAIALEEITNAREYPALDFIKSRVSDMHSSSRAKMVREWEKRIVFVNEQLPLTQEEKKSIHYCVMNSEMGKLVSNADILLETEDN